MVIGERDTDRQPGEGVHTTPEVEKLIADFESAVTESEVDTDKLAALRATWLGVKIHKLHGRINAAAKADDPDRELVSLQPPGIFINPDRVFTITDIQTQEVDGNQKPSLILQDDSLDYCTYGVTIGRNPQTDMFRFSKLEQS